MKNSVIFSYLFLMVAIVTTGCGPDRTEDDFLKEQAQKELEKLMPAAGIYRGALTTRKNGKLKTRKNGQSIGALVIELQPEFTQGKDGDFRPQPQAILRGTIDYFGFDQLTFSFRDAYFDPDTGRFKLTLRSSNIFSNDLNASDLEISGFIRDGKFSGGIEVTTFRDYGFEFSLQKDAPLPPYSSRDSDRLIMPENLEYEANVILGGKSPYQVRVTMSLFSSYQEGNERFLELLTPIRHVDVIIEFADGVVRHVFENVEWNTRSGTLTGRQRQKDMKTLANNLQCRATGSRSQSSGWRCILTGLRTASKEIIFTLR